MKLTIPEYLRKVKLSNKQRPTYFFWDGITVKAKGKELFRKYVNTKSYDYDADRSIVTPRNLVYDVQLKSFKGNTCIGYISDAGHPIRLRPDDDIPKRDRNRDTVHILCERYGEEKIIANPTRVGKPNYEIISGQTLYAGTDSSHIRNKIMATIKESFYPYVKDVPPFPIKSYPLRCRLYLFDTVKSMYDKTAADPGRRWDIINRAYPYSKAMMDLLTTGLAGDKMVMEPVLRDDDRLHLVEDGGAVFIPIEDYSKRKLVFVFWSESDVYPCEEVAELEQYRRNQIKNNEHYAWFQNQSDDFDTGENDLWS